MPHVDSIMLQRVALIFLQFPSSKLLCRGVCHSDVDAATGSEIGSQKSPAEVNSTSCAFSELAPCREPVSHAVRWQFLKNGVPVYMQSDVFGGRLFLELSRDRELTARLPSGKTRDRKIYGPFANSC